MVEVGDDDLASFGRNGAARRRTDAAGTSSDDDDPTLDELLVVASIPLNQHPVATGPVQPTLLDL